MNTLKIHFLNTIWSDAIVLENEGKFAFVDTGSKFYFPMIEKHLNDLNVAEIEFIILTHFHNDHYGNVANLIKKYNVNKLYLKRYYGLDGTTSSGYESNEEYIKHEFDNYNEILLAALEYDTEVIFIDEIGESEFIINFNNLELDLYDVNNRLFELYNNKESEYYQKKQFNENFNCLGVFVKVNDFNIFLGADVTCSKTDIVELKELSIKMIEKIYHKYNIDYIDIYKSCHHGGGGTNTLKLCELLKSKYVIITNTARWLDNYDTFDNLKKANPNVEILPTDFQKYIFEINDSIKYDVIKEDSLFITLNKN